MLLSLVFWRSVWRTFFVQAAWNFDRMQNVGFLYALLPFLRRTWKGEALSGAIARHIQFFNTHPYFAPLILGAVARLEDDRAAKRTENDDHVNALKLGLMGSLGAIGDSLFWAALRPLAAWIAVAVAILGYPWHGIVFFLILYNLPHMAIRVVGAATGYAAGIDVVAQLKRINFADLAQRLKGGVVVAAFATLPLLAWRVAPEADLRAAAVLLAVGVFVLIRKGVGGTRLALGFFAFVLAAGWLHETLGGV
jgi:mannose/fructose/N-acetylgalactosamine-specific phosphotransferase system component IID